MSKHHKAALLLAGAVAATSILTAPVFAQVKDPEKAPAYKLVPHADTQMAHELLQLYQPSLIVAQEAASKGAPAENMWKAQAIVANWEEIAKQGDSAKAAADYAAAMNAYLSANPDGLDGTWALDHAKFVFASLSQRVVTRMENWINTPKDRTALAPMAELAGTLLKRATQGLEASVHWYETHLPFDEAGYMRAFNSAGEVEYYNAWGEYFRAMALEPGAAERTKILKAAGDSLAKWADDTSDNGVNHQALLLRGKIRSEAGDLKNAAADLQKAMQPVATESGGQRAAPEWVQYQARYQIIVTQIRARDFAAAMSRFEEFKKTLPQENKVAMMSAEMLRYRITWAEADTKEGQAKKDTQLKALAILGDIIKVEPGFTNLIYEQLSSQIPDGTPMAELLPMQQIAIAFGKSQGQKGDTPESKAALSEAVKAAIAVRENQNSSASDKLEATYLAGICSAVLEDKLNAAKFSVEFAEKSPAKDERGKKMMDLALGQIGELRKSPSPEVTALVEKALIVAASKYGETKYIYYLGLSQLRANKTAEAAKTFARVPPTDPKYLEAQVQLVDLTSKRFSELTGSNAPQPDIVSGANDLFKACTNFITLLDNPPAGLPRAEIDRFSTFRTYILMTELETALNPSVNDMAKAKDRLTKLEGVRGTLPVEQQSAILRYKIQVMQATNASAEDIMKVVDEYAKASNRDPVEILQKMAFSTLGQIQKVEGTDPAQAKRLADFVVKLFDPIIEQKLKTDKKAAFPLREIKADMMVKAGDYKGAQALCLILQKDEPGRLSPFLTEARAIYQQALDSGDTKTYEEALDYFKRILPRLTPGNDVYWESWLRIILCMDKLKGSAAAPDIKAKLKDLQSSSPELGGELYKADFDRLLLKYGL